MTSAEDVLNGTLIDLKNVRHEGRVPVQYPHDWQDGIVSDFHEPDLAIDLEERDKRLTFEFQLENLGFLGPELFNELSGVGVCLVELGQDSLGLTRLEGVGVEGLFKASKKGRVRADILLITA